jgi:uncharacterized protein (DUF362 family)
VVSKRVDLIASYYLASIATDTYYAYVLHAACCTIDEKRKSMKSATAHAPDRIRIGEISTASKLMRIQSARRRHCSLHWG